MLSTNPRTIKACLPALQSLFSNHLQTYIDLFFHEKTTVLGEEAAALSRAGIIRQERGVCLPEVMVFPFRGKFIVTDFLLSIRKRTGRKFTRGLDDIWVMFPHETLLFIDRLGSIHGDRALDLASGSGAISLFLADRFKGVISSDINPKAVRYATFNAVLNNQEDRITVIESNLFQSISPHQFDFVCWNGPTVALPEVADPLKTYPLYSYGGFDGAEFTKKFIDTVFTHLNKDFTIKWWGGSLGDTRHSVVEQYLRQKLAHRPIRVTIEYLNPRRGVPVKEYDRLYEKYCKNTFDLPQGEEREKAAVEAWEEKLRKNKLTRVYISLITIQPSKKFEVRYKEAKKNAASPRHVFGFEWHKMSNIFIRKYLLAHNP